MVYSLCLLLLLSLSARGRFQVRLTTESRQLPQFDAPNPNSLVYGVAATQHYFATVALGTPPQRLEFTFDTFANNSWVVTRNCSSCKFKKKFRTNESKSYRWREERYFTQVRKNC
eukprot:TRINITY_DN14532_c0_g2_i4.p2 TRINITY_DN14532_c0_g2~~TRINITY_DN14532_c0_g2_i4.p2  ORF type:complete len:115 (-),score=17.37 TRINITY_DN14532_c0_g2_i4:899-1243(-)